MNSPMNSPMNFKTPGLHLVALMIGLLIGSVPAGATLRTIEQAYELTHNQIQLPSGPEGTLSVRRCATCPLVFLRVTTATAWFAAPRSRQARNQTNNQSTVLAAFHASATNPRALVYVYYEPQTLRVKRIVLDNPPATVAHR